MGMVMRASAAQNTFYFFHISTLLATRKANLKDSARRLQLILFCYSEGRDLVSLLRISHSLQRLNPVRGQTQHYLRKWLGFKPNPLNVSFIEAAKTSPPKRS